MALNIDLDGFGFLDSDSDVPNSSKLSPTLNKSPASPIESESSSGISSLDSDDLKKQLLSSPPTISISHDQQSNDGNSEYFQNQNDEDEEDDGMDEQKEDDDDDIEDLEVEDSEPVVVKDEIVEVQEEVIEVVQIVPVEVIYQNRNVLNLANNVWNSGRFIQYTVLPENNLSCFFQNRAQYWRLGNSSGFERSDTLEKCSCCDFSYPSIIHQQFNQHGPSMAKNNNAITDSLLTFLKNHHADNNINAMSNHNNINKIQQQQQQPPQRMYNNNAPYAAYQIIQNQYQQQMQQQNNGMNGFNHQMNPFNNSNNNNNNNNGNGGYNNGNSALALLNLMNQQTRNATAAGAFQQAMNNNSRYYNNNMNTNNGYGLYKQF